MTIRSGKREFQWPSVLWCLHLYILGIYGLYHLVFVASWLTVLFGLLIITMGYIGLTIGAHRLWAHQSFEANGFTKFILMLCHTLAGVGPIYDWVLAHRIHHKYYGTEKDLFNHNKGFLYSHFITNLLGYPSDYEKTAKLIDMRDIESDYFVWFQKRFYTVLFIIFGLLLPINAPAEYWDEPIDTAFYVIGFFRLWVLLNVGWLINSAKIIWGLQSKDKFPPDDNSVFIINKSFWPNYHYLMSWDWKTNEFGGYDSGFTSFLLTNMENIGLISSMKSASNESIRDALYKLSINKNKSITIDDIFDKVKLNAEYEAAKAKLRFVH
ncbi:hypothetical protein HCN44_000687 [Aphidius gifuensis]|uniref:Acyl-CoA desaturase n=1 Tax=Aphidius gifuensis TaxID=684658 RepID=A0A834XQV8_APHGI|nr:acyl-CoA Delta-9 desaturase [Aphidius gifuensis]KAF7990882.1 hypothetical protein HCN44_000687 [Aphidius gifuensis]